MRGNQWWLAYQPVSYRVESRMGTRAQFQSMVNTCHAAGVKVIVDAVINHMSGQDAGGTGWAGSSYSHYDYPGIYQTQDFHHCGRNGGDDIVNYNDRYEVQNCELVNLSDLKTESDYVRSKIAGYLNDLLALGVDGFRLDASKHTARTGHPARAHLHPRPPAQLVPRRRTGREPTNGCIRLTRSGQRELLAEVRPGSSVVVIDQLPTPPPTA